MKTVTYMGQVFEVPDEANFIAADIGGDVYVYECKPVTVGTQYSNYLSPTGSFSRFVGNLVNELPPCEAC